MNKAQEEHGAAAVVIVDGGVAGSERRDALGGDCSLFTAESCEAMVRVVEVILPMPVYKGVRGTSNTTTPVLNLTIKHRAAA